MAAGLQTHIWNNNIRCILLLAFYPFVLMGLVWMTAFVIGMGQTRYMSVRGPEAGVSYVSVEGTEAAGYATSIVVEFWPLILTVVVIWFMVSYFGHTAMIRKLAHSHTVTRREEPELYNLLENLCISRGIPMPRLEIIETHARNAFASGIDKKTYTITVTRGLLNSLTRDEVEAVLGHELTHILNRDVRLLIVTVIFTGMIGFLAQIAWTTLRHSLIFSGGRDRKGGGLIIILIVALILWIGYMATLLMRFALSRRREYMADAGAVELTKKPGAMMSALMRIAGRDHIPFAPADISMMCIENRRPFMGLFATHPPIEDRINTLSRITGTPVPALPHTGPSEKTARLSYENHPKNPWITKRSRARNPWRRES